jgi:hypothetical protein
MGVLAPTLPPPFPANMKSLRFYKTGAATANYVDNKWAFERPDPADPAVPEQGWSYTIQVRAVGGDLKISFDGTTDHGFILSGTQSQYQKRHEGGIYVKGAGTFHIEAW